MTGFMVFLREVISHPAQMGALFPSSKQLAQQLIKYIPADIPGLILELGAGTGAITEILLKQSYAKQVVAIESSAKLAQHLQKRLPQLKVRQGDAQTASQLLKGDKTPIQVIISGLPLHALPPETVRCINQEIERLLPPNGILIQYTYNLWGQLRVISPALHYINHRRVWRNLPPARIVVFQKKAHP